MKTDASELVRFWPRVIVSRQSQILQPSSLRAAVEMLCVKFFPRASGQNAQNASGSIQNLDVQ